MEKDPGIAKLAQECGRVRKQGERQKKMGAGSKRATKQGGSRHKRWAMPHRYTNFIPKLF